MPRRSGAWSSTSRVTTGTIIAQPSEYTPRMGRAHQGLTGTSAFSPTLSRPTPPMIWKPWRTCRCGEMRPASRPDSQAPAMMPPMVIRNR